jgi:pimeloyl-ACP methyl ester carboxylesterase
MHLTAPRFGIALLTTVIVASACNSSGSGSESTVAPVTTTPSSPATTDAGTNTDADVAGLFDIGGGRKMYLECWGEGSPTVVLLTGYRDTARIWDADLPEYPQPHVLPAVAGFTRVCAYDRPGTVGPYTGEPAQPSRSDAVPQPHAPDDVVADLHALLAAADVPGPYVLAGHSLGGAYVRLYAATYPDAVAGVVLIDAFNEYYRAAFTPEQWAHALAFMGTPPPGLDDPDLERADLDAVLDAVEAAVAAQPLPELPLAVLSRGREDELPPELTADLPPGLLEAQADAATLSQAQLSAVVPDARHVIAAESSHYIQVQQPALVIEAIRQVVEGVRHPNTWYDLVSCCAP